MNDPGKKRRRLTVAVLEEFEEKVVQQIGERASGQYLAREYFALIKRATCAKEEAKEAALRRMAMPYLRLMLKEQKEIDRDRLDALFRHFMGITDVDRSVDDLRELQQGAARSH